MSTTTNDGIIEIEFRDQNMTLTTDEARKLYNELKEIFDPFGTVNLPWPETSPPQPGGPITVPNTYPFSYPTLIGNTTTGDLAVPDGISVTDTTDVIKITI